MTAGLQVAIVGTGVALWVPAVLAAWRAASMRADFNREWHDRLDLVITGLSEQAAKALVDVQRLIRDVIVEGAATFDPLRVVAALPNELEETMHRFLKLLRVRGRTKRRLDRLLLVGPILLVFAAIYALGVVLGVLDISEIVDRPGLGKLGVSMALVGVAGLLGGFSAYAYLEHKLSGAEILSQANE